MYVVASANLFCASSRTLLSIFHVFSSAGKVADEEVFDVFLVASLFTSNLNKKVVFVYLTNKNLYP